MMQRAACPSCELTVHDMNDTNVARRAKSLGIRLVPSVVIDGNLALS
jgi:glutaredoxin 3